MSTMKKAKRATSVLGLRRRSLELPADLRDAFGEPEACGTWFVWGKSGSGKSSFVMHLARALSHHERVLYESLEEGTSLSFQHLLARSQMQRCGGNFLVAQDTLEEMKERLRKRRSPRVIIIDSIQYTGMSWTDYRKLVDEFADRLFVIISQVRGTQPADRMAMRVMYDAMLKIYVEGYRAHSKGRFRGPRGYYTIWEEGSRMYWGE